MLGGELVVGSQTISLKELDFAALERGGAEPNSCRASPGFAISPPRPRARRARGCPKRWSAAGCSRTVPRSTKPGRRICGASGSSSGQPMRLTSCRAATAAIARRCSTRSRAALGILKASADKARRRPRPGHRLVRRGRRRPARAGRRAAASPAARRALPGRSAPRSSTMAG